MVLYISKIIFALSTWHLALSSDICIMLLCPLLLGVFIFTYVLQERKCYSLFRLSVPVWKERNCLLVTTVVPSINYRKHSSSYNCTWSVYSVLTIDGKLDTWLMMLKTMLDFFVGYLKTGASLIGIMSPSCWKILGDKREESCLLEALSVLNFIVISTWVLVGLLEPKSPDKSSCSCHHHSMPLHRGWNWASTSTVIES